MNKVRIEFSQDTNGKHYIMVEDEEANRNTIVIDLNALTFEQIRETVNGLANIMSSMSAVMYKFGVAIDTLHENGVVDNVKRIHDEADHITGSYAGNKEFRVMALADANEIKNIARKILRAVGD